MRKSGRACCISPRSFQSVFPLHLSSALVLTSFLCSSQVFVERVEAQLADVPNLRIRGAIDAYYNQLAHASLESLQALAKMSLANTTQQSGDDEKGILYSQIFPIENARYFCVELAKVQSSAITQIVRRAETLFNDSLGSYVASVLRRPFGKMIDFADAVDLLMRSTPANEIQLHAAYSKSSFKRLAKEYTIKEMRKSIEAPSKRVQKHFADDKDTSSQSAADAGEDVPLLVWRSCEDNAAKEVDRFARISRYLLPDGSVTLELTPLELRNFFHAAAPPPPKRT